MTSEAERVMVWARAMGIPVQPWQAEIVAATDRERRVRWEAAYAERFGRRPRAGRTAGFVAFDEAARLPAGWPTPQG